MINLTRYRSCRDKCSTRLSKPAVNLLHNVPSSIQVAARQTVGREMAGMEVAGREVVGREVVSKRMVSRRLAVRQTATRQNLPGWVAQHDGLSVVVVFSLLRWRSFL